MERSATRVSVAETRTPQRADRLAPPPIGLGFLVHEVSRLLRRRFENRAREAQLEVSRMEATVLLAVARQQGQSQAALAHLLDIEPITLAHLLNRLQERALVERRPHATDRRIRTVWLRPAADPVIERIRKVTQAVRSEALSGFTDPAQRALIGALVAIRANLLRRPGTGAEALSDIWRELTGLLPEAAPREEDA